MFFDEICKTGTLQGDDTEIRFLAPFKKRVWSAPRASVTRITQQPGVLMTDLTIATTQGVYTAPGLATRKVQAFLALFPDIESSKVGAADKEWYHDQTRITHVATYTDEQAMQREVESAALNGWAVQSTTGTAGHVHVGRTATTVALLGPLALIGGASRSKDNITITFVRASKL